MAPLVNKKKRGGLTDEAKAARAKYAREWRKKNPEKQKAITARYWEKKAQEAAAESKEAVGFAEG